MGEARRKTVSGTTTDPVFLINASVATAELLDLLRLRVTISNVFDEEYSHPGGLEHPQPTLPQYGRRINAEIGIRF
jgi:hypothetical protein